MGDLDTNPIETAYRGVIDCAGGLDEPPVDCVYAASKKHGQTPEPQLSTKPCLAAPGGEL